MKTLALIAMLSAGCLDMDMEDVETVEQEATFLGYSWLANGGFERGVWPWSYSGNAGVYTSYPRSGELHAALGGAGCCVYSRLSQTVSIPSDAASAKLTFYLDITSEEPGTLRYDKLTLSMIDTSNNGSVRLPVTWTSSSRSETPGSYTVRTDIDMLAYKGKQLRLEWLAQVDSYYSTMFRIDDVSLRGTYQQPELSPQ